MSAVADIPRLRIPLEAGSRGGPVEPITEYFKYVESFARLTHGTRFPANLVRPEGQLHPWLMVCHHRKKSAVFVLRCHAHRITLAVGETGSPETRPLLSQIRARSPMMRAVDLTPAEMTRAVLAEPIGSFQAGTHLFGHPLPPEELRDVSPHGSVLRAYRGENWCVVIRLEPVPALQVDELAKLLSGKLSGATRKTDVSAQEKLHAELLDHWMNRMQAAKYEGFWKPRAQVFAGDPSLASEVAAAYASALGYSPHFPMRIGPADSKVASWQAEGAPEFTRDKEWLGRDGLLTNEASWLCELPHEEYEGHLLLPECRFGVAPEAPPGDKRKDFRFALGHVLDRHATTKRPLEIDIDDLSRHALITGLTGSGKTTTCQRLIESMLGSPRAVPFLVIEPAKDEYHKWFVSLRKRMDCNIFGIGKMKEGVAPLRLNPFVPSVGFPIQRHIDFVCQLFQASFNFWGPQVHMIVRAIHEVYLRAGWDLDRGVFPSKIEGAIRYPRVCDLIEALPVVVGHYYHDKFAEELLGAILARLERLRGTGAREETYSPWTSVPEEELFEKPCLIKLTDAGLDDEKAFLMGLIFTRLYEYHEVRHEREETGQAAGRDGGKEGLKHLTLIEEAHRLFRRTTSGTSGEDGNSRALSIEIFTNLLAEIRAYGEGIILAEQIPQKLVSDAIKNTNLKIAHRLVHGEDRNLIGQAMNLSYEQAQELTLFEKGQAVVHFEGLTAAVHVQVEGSQPHLPDKIVLPEFKSPTQEASLRRVLYECAHAAPKSRLKPEFRTAVGRFWLWLRDEISLDPAEFLARANIPAFRYSTPLRHLWQMVAGGEGTRSNETLQLADDVVALTVHVFDSKRAPSVQTLENLRVDIELYCCHAPLRPDEDGASRTEVGNFWDWLRAGQNLAPDEFLARASAPEQNRRRPFLRNLWWAIAQSGGAMSPKERKLADGVITLAARAQMTKRSPSIEALALLQPAARVDPPKPPP